MQPPSIDLAYYGDDFTGSTDVLETLSLNGMPTSLWVDAVPASSSLPLATRAVGVAGLSRTMSPAEMDRTLPAAFQSLASVTPRFVHYKTCSTFDSSPSIGSVGRAIEIGRRVFRNRITPLVVAAPALGRYSAFGNLFARSGLDSDVFRLDRHPSMSRHPVTPMDEADLTRHLARQTNATISLVNLLALDRGTEAVLDEVNRAPEGVVLFDAIHVGHLKTIGAVLDTLQRRDAQPLFVVGSSGVEAALTSYWRPTAPPDELCRAAAVQSLAVVSGSRSSVTARQIIRAVEHGFVEIVVEPTLGACAESINVAAASLAKRFASEHDAGRSVIVRMGDANRSHLSGQQIGALLGQVLFAAMQTTRMQRVVVVGGDTSGAVARTLGIESLEMMAPMAPGAPLCTVRSRDDRIDGAEFVFKGGQVGRDDFFMTARNGGAISPQQDFSTTRK